MQYSDNKAFAYPPPSHRSGPTLATAEKQEVPRIIEETRVDEPVKPDISVMHGEIVALQDKLKQLERLIADRKPPIAPKSAVKHESDEERAP